MSKLNSNNKENKKQFKKKIRSRNKNRNKILNLNKKTNNNVNKLSKSRLKKYVVFNLKKCYAPTQSKNYTLLIKTLVSKIKRV